MLRRLLGILGCCGISAPAARLLTFDCVGLTVPSMSPERKPPVRAVNFKSGEPAIWTTWTKDDGGRRCEFTLQDMLGDWGWDLDGVARVVGGRIVVTELTFRLSEFVKDDREIRRRLPGELPPEGVNSDVLRHPKMGEVVALLRRELRDASETRPDLDAKWKEAAAVAIELKRGRGGYPDGHFLGLAVRYLQLRADGLTNGITGALAQEYDRPEATIRDWIRQAERREYLTEAAKGRGGTREAGPRLTDQTGEGA